MSQLHSFITSTQFVPQALTLDSKALVVRIKLWSNELSEPC